MRFDINGRLEYIYNSLRGDPSVTSDEENQIWQEIGDKAFFKLRDLATDGPFHKSTDFKNLKKEDLFEIKQAYIKHKETYRPGIIAGYNWIFFKENSINDVKDYVINQVVNEQMFYSYDPNIDFFEELCKLTTKTYVDENGKEVELKGPEFEEKKSDIKKIVQQYIKNGYNPYNIMNQLTNRYNELKEHNKQEKDPETLKFNQTEMAQNIEICQIIENTEKTFSPYNKVFETAEHLGELINKAKELEKQDKFEESDKLNEEIETYKDKILKTLENGKFDLLELESIVNGKAKYLRDSQNAAAINSAYRDIYYGLAEMAKLVHFKNINQVKNENNL